LGKYSLGNKRTLEQYIEFTGINPHTGVKHTKSDSRCAPVYVPWFDNSSAKQRLEFAPDANRLILRGDGHTWKVKWIIGMIMLFIGCVLGVARIKLSLMKKWGRQD
jgi:hypothetical protein